MQLENGYYVLPAIAHYRPSDRSANDEVASIEARMKRLRFFAPVSTAQFMEFCNGRMTDAPVTAHYLG